jgi:glycosyltransferase involved in cell wall biosynthesis
LPPLVIVGTRGWLTRDVLYQMQYDPLLKDKFIMLDNLGDDALLWLYEHCRFTVFPSTYEGWGLPVGESLAHGKVCITSRTSSLPEIAGPLLDYISPYNTQEMLDAMMRWMDDKQLHKKETQIVREYRPTSWDDTYREVADFVAKTAL